MAVVIVVLVVVVMMLRRMRRMRRMRRRMVWSAMVLYGYGYDLRFFVEHVKETWSSPVETRLPYLETSA